MGNVVERAVALVRERAPRCGVTRLVCVDGRSGAGKTTWAAELAAALGAPPGGGRPPCDGAGCGAAGLRPRAGAAGSAGLLTTGPSTSPGPAAGPARIDAGEQAAGAAPDEPRPTHAPGDTTMPGGSGWARAHRASPAVPVVHMDDLYPGWDGLAGGVERLLGEVVAPLARAEPARYRRWDWARGRPGEEVLLGVPEVLVVEGAGAGAAYEHAVLTVFVDAPAEERHRRAIARDGDTYAPHWDRWARQEDAYLRRVPVAELADLVVRS